MKGYRKYSNLGKSFEDMITTVNVLYDSMGEAAVEYIPIAKGLNAKGQMYYKQKGKVDFVGFDRKTGIHIAFDAKDISNNKTRPGKLVIKSGKKGNEHQLEHLRKVSESGAYGFYLVLHSNGNVYMVPPEAFDGTKTANVSDYPVVPRGKGQIYFDYLKILREKENV